jgi:putative endopeptidase
MQRSRWILTLAVLYGPFTWAAQAPADAHVVAVSAGIDPSGMDKSVQPGDDFDRYANGRWEQTTVIPSDRSTTSVFSQVSDLAEKRNAELFKSLSDGHPAAGSNQAKIADYYAAYMDQAAIEQRGLKPLEPTLQRIAAIDSPAALAEVLGAQLRTDVDPVNNAVLHTEHLFGLFVSQGLEDPDHNLPYLLQGGLGMPDRDYYLASDAAMVANRGKYQDYIATLLKLAGVTDAPSKAKAILALESKLAKAHASIVDSEDIHKANNPWALGDFASKAPGLDWSAYFKAAHLDGQKTVVVWQPQAIIQTSALVASEPLDTWKAYLAFHAINEAATLLPKAYADASFEFYGHTLQGTPQQSERWKRAISATNRDLGDAVGQLYVQRYFPASSKAQAQRMVTNILAAFGQRVDGLSWMTPATKRKARAKLATIRVGVGYPETWRNYASLAIRRDDPLGNHERAQAFEYQHQLDKLGKTPDKGEWWMVPQTVNAVNLPLQNALNFPAAILEAPIFDPNADAASNYGAIGAVMGHEISHSFDNLGAEFDGEGRLANWWTPEDLAHFKATGQKLVAQYNAYEPLPGLHINGQQTLGENIADVSGLTIAYLAYHNSLGGKSAPVIGGLTGDQRFFLAFAQLWRGKSREAALRAQVIGDAHSPGRFRVQTVRNLDAWYEAFSPKPGQQLYLAPDQRVHIW